MTCPMIPEEVSMGGVAHISGKAFFDFEIEGCVVDPLRV
jgi:hypothetical protein